MVFQIVSTTDGKYINEFTVFNKVLKAGDTVVYKDVEFKLDSVKWLNEKTVKLVSSSYIAVLQVKGK